MKKQILAGVLLFTIFVVAALGSKAFADDILGCYQKEHGQLRIVNSHSECLNSENPITLGTSGGTQNLSLECMTGMLNYSPSEVPNYCQDSYSVVITNPYPSDMNPEDVFDVYCEVSNDDAEVWWGLKCDTEKGWKNTGCTAGSFGEDMGVDLPQFSNGCYTDYEEYGKGNIFTTCCKIVQQ